MVWHNGPVTRRRRDLCLSACCVLIGVLALLGEVRQGLAFAAAGVGTGIGTLVSDRPPAIELPPRVARPLAVVLGLAAVAYLVHHAPSRDGLELLSLLGAIAMVVPLVLLAWVRADDGPARPERRAEEGAS